MWCDERRACELASFIKDGPARNGAGAERPVAQRREREEMTYETILYDVEDRTATITFNRPDKLNAISRKMEAELSDAYARAETDDDVWTIVVTATGRAFCTGADVDTVRDDGKIPFDGRYLSQFHEWDAPQEATPPFRQMAKPIIVGVNGICCGAGMDLVTTGDIAIASEQAQFFDPHVSIGLVSGREMVRVARTLPLNVAMRMAIMGRQERLGAARMYELGLITEVVEHDALAGRLKELAEMVNRNAPLAVRGTRLAIRKGLGIPLYEAELLAEAYRERVLHTEDAKEGPRAFMEKREPQWRAE
jgi:enoyl-CoA hydratase/carnithine racemase